MKKSIKQILDTCAAEMQSARDAIGKMVDDSKGKGVEWPELEEEPEDDTRRAPICRMCHGNGCHSCNYEGRSW